MPRTIYIWLSTFYISCIFSKYLAIFRPRSRNTYTFHPLTSWDLPKLEMHFLSPRSTSTEYNLEYETVTSLIHRIKNDFNCEDTFNNFIRTVNLSILMHSLHREIAHGHTIENCAENTLNYFKSEKCPFDMNANLKFYISTLIMGESYIPSAYIEETYIQKFVEILCQYPCNIRRSDNEMDADLHFQIIVDLTRQDQEAFYFTVPVTRGTASSKIIKNNLREFLPNENACRRPRTGVLKAFALSNLPYKVKTSMEPELSLLMSSFANLNAISSILDPFCGSCNLLLAATIKYGY